MRPSLSSQVSIRYHPKDPWDFYLEGQANLAQADAPDENQDLLLSLLLGALGLGWLALPLSSIFEKTR